MGQKGLRIKIEVKRVMRQEGDPYFYIVWSYYIEGKKHYRGSHFPFSMS